MAGSKILKDPVVLTGLILRLFLLGYVLWQGNWMMGDSAHYLHFASKVCGGDWGGEAGKGPFYLWYLCLLSPHIQYPELSTVLAPPVNSTISPLVALPLFLQTLSVWFFGVVLLKKTKSKLIAFFWLFDPVLLAYSSIVMPEALFGIAVGLTTLLIWRMADRPASYSNGTSVLAGICLGIVALIRTNGLLMMLATLSLMTWLGYERKLKVKQMILVCIGFCALIAPRVYWNGTRYGQFSLAKQGPGWIMSVAGVVANKNSGLDFPSSEKKWLSDHPDATSSMAWRTLVEYPLDFVFLTTKGALRVLFGHVNVEWGTLFTGSAPVGPGWWHPQESRTDGLRVDGPLLFLWVAGMLFTAIFCFALYSLVLRGLYKSRRFDAFDLWCLSLIILQALLPLVYGEARFRLGIWPLALVWLARIYHRGQSLHLNKTQRSFE